MKIWPFLLFPLCSFAKEAPVTPVPLAEPAATDVSTEELAKIGPVVTGLIEDGKLAGASVLVMQKGGVIYQENFGHRDLAAGKPMENDTLFRIFSMTKGLTSTAALMLCEEGKLSLDDPIELHLSALKNREIWVADDKTTKARRSTTVRDLLRHTSGYPSGWGGDPVSRIYRKNWKPEENVALLGMVEKIAPGPLLYEPGTRWVYGLSSDLLAAVVTKAAKMPFEKFLQERLLQPLGMKDTGYVVPAEEADRLAVNYRVRDGELEVADPAEGSSHLKDPAFKGGGSGLVSTITDYARFLQMIANGGEFQGKRYLREDTVDLMRTNQLPRNIPCISFGDEQRYGTGFGLGFAVRYATDDRWDPDAVVGEYGWGGAASTHYWLSPEDGLIVVTMEQTMPYNWNLEMKLKPIIYRAVRKNSQK